MKYSWIVFVIFLTVTACSPTQQLLKVRQQAENAAVNQEYERSLLLWEQLIADDEANQKQSTSDAYEKAGDMALALGDLEKAETYYKLAVYYKTATPKTYQYLATYYRNQNNLSKEVAALEPLISLFPDSEEAKEEKLNLYWRYVETGQNEKARALWPPTANAEKDEALLESWFSLNKKIGNDELLGPLANQLLNLNKDNIIALDYKAMGYYDKAENRYQMEIQAYEKNKTGKQYQLMLAGLDASTADFKRALKLFEKLFLDTQNKKYALYIANIYARFGDEKQSVRYRKLAE